MRIVYNDEEFERINEAKVAQGFYGVICKDKNESRMLLREDGLVQWVDAEEMMTRFTDVTAGEISRFFGKLKRHSILKQEEQMRIAKQNGV